MAQTPFKFQNVQIDKTNHLGIGRKIVVYKATCDGLACAAKMLDTRDVSENVQLAQANQELKEKSQAVQPQLTSTDVIEHGLSLAQRLRYKT